MTQLVNKQALTNKNQTTLLEVMYELWILFESLRRGSCFSGIFWMKSPSLRKPRTLWCPALHTSHNPKIKHSCPEWVEPAQHQTTCFPHSHPVFLKKFLIESFWCVPPKIKCSWTLLFLRIRPIRSIQPVNAPLLNIQFSYFVYIF